MTFDGLPTFVLLLVVDAALFGGFIPAEKIATKKLFRHFDRKKIEWRGQNSKTESFISFVNTFFVVRKKNNASRTFFYEKNSEFPYIPSMIANRFLQLRGNMSTTHLRDILYELLKRMYMIDRPFSKIDFAKLCKKRICFI